MALGFPEIIIILGFLALFVFVVRMFLDAIHNENLSKNARVIWGIVIIFTYPLGALYYLYIRSGLRPAKTDS